MLKPWAESLCLQGQSKFYAQELKKIIENDAEEFFISASR